MPPGSFKATVKPDGSVEYEGDPEQVMAAVDRERRRRPDPPMYPSPAASPRSTGEDLARISAARHVVEKYRQQQQRARIFDDPEFRAAARRRLFGFFDMHLARERPFSNLDAMSAWAGRTIVSVDENGEQPVEYAKILPIVKLLIQQFAHVRGVALSKFRMGKGSGYRFEPRKSPAPQSVEAALRLLPQPEGSAERRGPHAA